MAPPAPGGVPRVEGSALHADLLLEPPLDGLGEPHFPGIRGIRYKDLIFYRGAGYSIDGEDQEGQIRARAEDRLEEGDQARRQVLLQPHDPALLHPPRSIRPHPRLRPISDVRVRLISTLFPPLPGRPYRSSA